MYFDVFKAGALESIINSIINQIPAMVKNARNPDVKKYFMYKNEDDFVLGYILGRMTAQSENILTILYGRNLELGEYQELSNLLNTKMPQIRNKIYETG